MGSCYLCGIKLEENVDDESKNHHEHIIPQALGGQLVIKGILCKECGGDEYLSGKIDKPFCDIFSLVTGQLDIKKDRKTNTTSIEGKYYLLDETQHIDINLKRGNISHKRPSKKFDHDKKIAYVYANDKVAPSYKTHVENSLKKMGKNHSEYEIKIISSLNDYLGILELPFKLDDEVFAKGLTKIAIEFALSKGVAFVALKHLINRDERTIECNNIVIPYFPIAKIEEMMERTRTSIDSNFMSHSLVLFSQRQVHKKHLYCFIELFGTFQYFVELNSNYTGVDIEPKSYSQRIIKAPKLEIKKQDFNCKDFSVFLKDFGLEFKDVERLSYEETCVKLQSLYNKKNNYIFDYSENTKRILESTIRYAILKSDKNIPSIFSELRPHFYRDKKDDDFHITFFRSRFMLNGNPYSLIPEIRELYSKNKDKIKEYTYFKFKELNNYINENKTPLVRAETL